LNVNFLYFQNKRGCNLVSHRDDQRRMEKILIISPEKCTGCRSCELACSFGKTKAFNPQDAAVSVFAYDEAAVSVPIMCLQCENAACMNVCGVGAITRNELGTVIVSKEKCIGCKLCVSACPFGNMSFNSKLKQVVKCDLCGGDPACAKICPSGTIEFKEATPEGLSKKKLVADKFKALFSEVDE
jgi:anaerobic carbon-monoxide dehydrogenase iron sulfur subunit